MKSVRFNSAPVIIGIITVLFLLMQTDSYAQRILYLNKGNSGASDSNPTGITSFDIRIGETFTLDVWFDLGTTVITGISTYITFDEKVFEIIDQNLSVPGIQPFLLSGGFSVFTQPQANLVEDPNNIAGFQIAAHAQLSTGQTLSGKGRFGRIALRAIGVTPGSEITIDFDPQHFRDTRMFFLDLTSRKFDIYGSATVGVLGINVQGIPDILMEPGQTLDRYLDLDDFLINPPDDLSALGWFVTDSQDSVLVTIDENTHEISVTAVPGFTGFRNFIFTVSDQLGVQDSDTMRVIVTYSPEFEDTMPNPIVLNEDEIFISLFLDTLAGDRDDGPSSLIWSGISKNENIILSVDDSVSRTFAIQGTKDFFGPGEVVFVITDPHGATDLLLVNVNIIPVNDPPLISGIPDIHILPGQVDTSIVLQDYTTDVDSGLETITYSWTGAQNVNILMDANTRLTISGTSGFTGTETIIFKVYDINPSSSSFDAVNVTVGPKAPLLIAPLPDTTIFSADIISTVQYVDLDDFVADDDDPLSNLIWSAQGDQLSVTIGKDHIANFIVPASMHDFENVIFTVSDPGGASVSDTVTVLVLDNGRPLIYNMPDILFVTVGGDTTLTLDDFVVDADTPLGNLTWSTSGNQNIIINIGGSSPHVATILSPNQTFAGQETVVFTVSDPDNHLDTHTMVIQAVAQGRPIVSDIPDIEITSDRPGSIDLDDYLIIFPESERANVQWSVSPLVGAKVNVSINPGTNVATFAVVDRDFKGTREFTFTAVNTANGETGSDAMTVTVTIGKIPILGNLPDVEFTTGDSSTAIQLDKYVIDEDSPDDILLWEVESVDIIPVEENLARGANHLLLLTAPEGFVDFEDIVLTVTDLEGNSASDTMRVFVRSSTMLDLTVIPNPVSADYIDIVIFTSDTIIGAPEVILNVNGQFANADVHRIAGEFIWKADFVFDMQQTGQVRILATAADKFRSTIKDSIEFTLGLLSKTEGYRYSDKKVNLSFPPDFISNDTKILVIPDGRMKIFSWLLPGTRDYLHTLDTPFRSYYIGSGLREEEIRANGNLSFDLKTLALHGKKLKKYGIYYMHPESHEIQFVSDRIEPYTHTIQTEIDRFGLYFVAADNRAPDITIVDQIDPESLMFRARINERGSGINSFQTVIDSREYNNTVNYQNDNVYEIRIDDFDLKGNSTLYFSVTDRAGNVSRKAVMWFSRNSSPRPNSYTLMQNYPNPFNPTTKIRYELPQYDFVTLIVYNALGKKVRTLVNRSQPPGTYTVEWDARNDREIHVSAGVYVYVLKTKTFNQIRKMVLLK